MGEPSNTGIAPGAVNTVASGMNMVRIPLGTRASDKQVAGPTTMFWVVIPTNTGGELTVTHQGTGGTLQVVESDGVTPIKCPGNGTKTVVYSIAAPFHGKVFILATGGDLVVGNTRSRDVSAELVQVSFAREGTGAKDPPIVPWNFYFWPGSRKFGTGEHAKVTLATLRKFARAFKKDQDAAAKWEFDNHQTSLASGWMGHCHNAARATLYFEQPTATTINGETFDEEELEFIAAEWVGNYGKADRRFSLDKGVAPWGAQKYLFLPRCFKPGGPISEEELARAFSAYKADLAKDEAARLAAEVFKEKGLADNVKKYFGELAAELYTFLLDKVRRQKLPFVADLRSQYDTGQANEVWNHAVFYYEARFVETDPPKQDPLDVLVTITMLANADVYPSSGLPAAVVGSSLDVSQTSISRRRSIQVLRLVFSNGEIAAGDKRNEWRSSRGGDSGKELFAPDDFGLVQPFDAKTATKRVSDGTPQGNMEAGNPCVELDAISGAAPVLKLRKRFRR